MTRKALTPFIIGLAVIFLGAFVFTFFNIYDSFPHLDKVFHISGGIIIAWFFSNLWSEKFKGFDKFQRVIIFMALGVLVGFFWEIMEYSTSQPPLVSHELLRYYIYGGNLTDTLGDLVADVFGGALFGLLKR